MAWRPEHAERAERMKHSGRSGAGAEPGSRKVWAKRDADVVWHGFTQMSCFAESSPILVDRAGNLFVCGPGGVWVISPQGEQLGLIRFPEDPHNLAWGDDDARTLYVCALTSVYRLRTAIPGVRPGMENR